MYLSNVAPDGFEPPASPFSGERSTT